MVYVSNDESINNQYNHRARLHYAIQYITVRSLERQKIQIKREIFSWKTTFDNIDVNFEYSVCSGYRREQEYLPGVEARTGSINMGEQNSFPTLQLPSSHRLHARRTLWLPLE